MPSLPARIRVNASFPFPALVSGTGPVAISKSGGIWTVGLSIDGFTTIPAPPAQDLPIDYLMGWNSTTKSFFKISISNLQTSLNIAAGAARTQRFVTTTPIVVAPTDQIITCKITSAASCTLPSANGRAGVPLTFKDLGQATANHITLTVSGADTIEGISTYVITNNFAEITLVPFTDGTNTGWFIS